MANKVLYYDVCPECDSSDIAIAEQANDDGLLTFRCRFCGIDWTDYVDDIQQDYK